MLGLFDRDYTILNEIEKKEKEIIDEQHTEKLGKFDICRSCFRKYPKAVRHNLSLFPNHYMDIVELENIDYLRSQCDDFESLLNNPEITELDIKEYIQDNKYYHIPASIFRRYNFGHHEAVLFKEFSLGTLYRADYLLVGKSSSGWQFIFVEFENPYGNISLKDGNIGQTIRKGINQIDDWKGFIEANYDTLKIEFRKYTTKDLPDEFISFDSTRMHYVVIAGRRSDYSEKTRLRQRKLELENNILLLHYDNLLDDARDLIGAKSY